MEPPISHHFWSSGQVRLCRQSITDLRHLTTLRTCKHVGRPIALLPDTAVGWVDAGPRGWGGRLLSRPDPVAGFWSAWEAGRHITFRELRAVRLFLEHYVHSLRGRRLLLWEDNQAVVAMIASLTSHSPELVAELRLIVELLDLNDIHLRSMYIRSEDNVEADYYSRIARAREYILSRAAFELVESWWGPFTVDAFAGPASAQLPRFWAEAHSCEAEAVDAFAQVWVGEHVWAHPPPCMLPQLVQLLHTQPLISAAVCVPHWPGSTWFRELMELSSLMATLPAGSLQRVAFDAPQMLESWPVTVFLVEPRQ